MITRLVLLVIVIITVGSVAQASGSERSSKDAKAPTTSVINVVGPEASPTEPPRKCSDCALKGPENKWDSVTGIGTLLLAVFTALLAGTAIWQARLSSKTAQSELRAYLSAAPDRIFNFNAGLRIQMRYTVTNHGETPAYRVTNTAAVEILPYPLPENYQFKPLERPAQSTYALQPRQVMLGNVWASQLYTEAELAKAIAGDGCRIYCYGRVNYVDAFGEHRETEFCRSVVPSDNLRIVGTAGSNEMLDVAYEITALHNNAT